MNIDRALLVTLGLSQESARIVCDRIAELEQGKLDAEIARDFSDAACDRITAERAQLAAKCAEMREALKSITLIEWNEENAIDYWRQAHDIAIIALSETK